MDPIRGLRADQSWQPLLSGSARGTVGSSFEHAINLRLDGTDELLTVVSVESPLAPGLLVVDASNIPRTAVGTAVAVNGGRVSIRGWSIDLSDVSLGSCAVVLVTDPTVADPARCRSLLARVAAPGSFVAGSPTDGGAPSAFEAALRRRLLEGATRFQAAVAGPERQFADVTRGLVGLGIGLTPSGDDYLVGALALLHHLGDPLAGRLGHAVVHRLASDPDCTTEVSAHFLRAAAAGRFHQHIAQAARAVLTSSADLDTTFRQVVAIGSTSGTDALFGLVDTLTTCTAAPATSHLGVSQ